MESTVMTLKDWIVLLIPIAINGIILANINKIVDRKLSRFTKVDEYESKILVSFLEQIDNAMQCFNMLQKAWTNKEHDYNENDILKEYKKSMQALYDSSIVHVFLNKYTFRIERLFQHSQELIAFINKQIAQRTPDCQKQYDKKIKRIRKDFKKLYRVRG